MAKRGRPIKQYWDPLYGERKMLRRCVHCTGDCKVFLPYDQKEEKLKGHVECARTGFHYTPGVTSAPERKLDFQGLPDL
jgi:hypothetical protein